MDEEQNEDVAVAEPPTGADPAAGPAGEETNGEPAAAAAEAGDFDHLAEAADGDSALAVDAIRDIPVKVTMELGSTQVTIDQLLKLNRGSVVSLDRLAGEPLDVLVNGCLIAHGEVVVVDERFGIRLTDILSPRERVSRLDA